MKKNSVKNRRVNDEVMRSLSEIIRNVKDPRVSPFTSILECEVAPDLKTCKIFVSVLGSDEDAKQTLEGLNSANGFIRSELARDVNLRITPEQRFIIDDSITYGVEMSRKIDDVIAADEAAEKARLQNNE